VGAAARVIAGGGGGDGGGGDLLKERAGSLPRLEGEWFPIEETELVVRLHFPSHFLFGFDSGEGAVGVFEEARKLGLGHKIGTVEGPRESAEGGIFPSGAFLELRFPLGGEAFGVEACHDLAGEFFEAWGQLEDGFLAGDDALGDFFRSVGVECGGEDEEKEEVLHCGES